MFPPGIEASDERFRQTSEAQIASATTNRDTFGEISDLRRVYGFCRLYTRTVGEADDITSLTFERAFVALPRFVVTGPISNIPIR